MPALATLVGRAREEIEKEKERKGEMMPNTVLKNMCSAITYSCCPGTQTGHEGGHKAYPGGKEMRHGLSCRTLISHSALYVCGERKSTSVSYIRHEMEA